MSPLAPFESLPDDAVVFRLANVASTFLPADAAIPNAEFWTPSTKDKEEGEARGRPSGVSVWNRRYTSPQQAAKIRAGATPPPARAFAATVGEIIAVGRRHGRKLRAVADPLPAERGPGAHGHALIEGLARPDGVSRVDQKLLLTALVQILQEIPCL